jgi:hypothetical protein
MPNILSRPEWVSRVMSVVVDGGLGAERVEVRVKAGGILGGLLHCQFVGKEKRQELMVRNGVQISKAATFTKYFFRIRLKRTPASS